MSHTDRIAAVPAGFHATAGTAHCLSRRWRTHRGGCTQCSSTRKSCIRKRREMLRRFLFEVCGCTGDWQMASLCRGAPSRKCGRRWGIKKVLCGLSGGVDSSVAAVLVARAVGKQLTCIFVDHGLLRKNEGDRVEEMFTSRYDISLSGLTLRTGF